MNNTVHEFVAKTDVALLLTCHVSVGKNDKLTGISFYHVLTKVETDLGTESARSSFFCGSFLL